MSLLLIYIPGSTLGWVFPPEQSGGMIPPIALGKSPNLDKRIPQKSFACFLSEDCFFLYTYILHWNHRIHVCPFLTLLNFLWHIQTGTTFPPQFPNIGMRARMIPGTSSLFRQEAHLSPYEPLAALHGIIPGEIYLVP